MRRMVLFFSVLIVLASLISLTASSASRLDLNRLLVAYLCDEGSGDVLKDSSGNGWDATVPNAKWVDGVFGKAIRLQRTCSQVKGNIIDSTVKTGEISIMCWFNMANHSTYNGLVSIASPKCDASCCYRLMVNPSKNPFWNAGQHSDKQLAKPSFELNRWYHYAMVCNGAVTKIYVDGEFVGEVAENFKLPDLGEVNLYVGTGEKPGTWTVEDCTIDEVLIWDKALDDEEIELVTKGFKVFSVVNSKDKIATTWGYVKEDICE